MFSLLSGDDYDIGKVTGYRFVIAENYSALLDPLAEVQTLVGFQQPDEAGVSTSYQFGLARIDDHYNKDLFLGLLAFDEKDNEGSMSNIGRSLKLNHILTPIFDSTCKKILRFYPSTKFCIFFTG